MHCVGTWHDARRGIVLQNCCGRRACPTFRDCTAPSTRVARLHSRIRRVTRYGNVPTVGARYVDAVSAHDTVVLHGWVFLLAHSAFGLVS
jgi:hypothetical protein